MSGELGVENGIDLAQYEPLVKKLARRHARRVPASVVGREDLEQAGRVGLLLAARRYDPSRGTKFLSWAYHYVDGYIQVECYRAELEPQSRVQRAHREGLAVTNVVSATNLGVPRDAVPQLLDRRSVEMDSDGMIEFRRRLREVLSCCSQRESYVIVRRFVFEETLQAIGDSMGVSHERARQIMERGFKKYRQRDRRAMAVK